MASIIYTAQLNNGSNLILPTTADTLVGLETTDTLINKTLTAPTITGAGAIAGVFTGDITGDVTGNADTSTKISSITNSNIVQLTSTQTLTNKTLTEPKFANGGFIADSAGLALVKFVQTPTAINEVTITNSAASNPVIISATGTDTNVSLQLVTQGSGTVLTPTLKVTGATADGITLEPFMTAAGNTSELRFKELAAGGSNYVGFKAPDAIAGADDTGIIWTLPDADGSADQVLKTNGSGVLSFTTSSSGASTLNALTDVNMSSTGFTNSLLIQTNSSGVTPTTDGSLASTGSVGIGTGVFTNLTTGDRNVCLGNQAGQANTVQTASLTIVSNNGSTTAVLTGASGVADFYVGYYVSFSGATITDSKYYISAYNSGTSTITFAAIAGGGTPSGTATIYNVSAALTTGSNNTFVGSESAGVNTADNQTSLGLQAFCSGANQVTLGNPSVTALRCADTTIASLSDQRDKTDIVDSTYGLDFVSTLRPVQFKWDRRNLVAGDETSAHNGKTRVGFIAQELQAAMPANENDVLDLVYDVNPERIEAKYGNLIPILTKAIQDLSAANDVLVARVAALESA